MSNIQCSQPRSYTWLMQSHLEGTWEVSPSLKSVWEKVLLPERQSWKVVLGESLRTPNSDTGSLSLLLGLHGSIRTHRAAHMLQVRPGPRRLLNPPVRLLCAVAGQAFSELLQPKKDGLPCTGFLLGSTFVPCG